MSPHAHFVAVGGTGMGSLAGLLRGRGWRVTGSDRALYPPMSEMLRRWAVEVRIGYDAGALLAERPDLVVIGNAVRPDNPEARAAIENGLRYRSFPDALYELAIAEKHPVVVAGTHGKTTTTSLIASLLVRAGLDPSLLVGGIALDFGSSFRDGSGPHFVVEGDEYDTAFFDKTPKFLHYHPRTLVLTSLEFDHADIYRDLAAVERAFGELIERLPEEATLVVALDAPRAVAVARAAACRKIGYAVEATRTSGSERDPGAGGAGSSPALAARWEARGLRPESGGTRFDVVRDGCRLGEAYLPLHGRHNVANALAAVATACALGVAPETALAALAAFRGVRRRQELRGEVRGVAVIDDFAHHPTAVRETLAALRARFPGRRLLAAFEPRSNTSRRDLFQRAYAEALAGADAVAVARVPDAPIYSATGPVTRRLDADRLAAELRAAGVAAQAFDGAGPIADHLASQARPGDVVVVMSNGSFDGLCEKLLARLGERAAASGRP